MEKEKENGWMGEGTPSIGLSQLQDFMRLE